MAASIFPQSGRRQWSLSRERERGHRTYKIKHLVITTDSEDGPQTVLDAPGLPQIGAVWNFGNDNDIWAFCTPEATVSIHESYPEGDPAVLWMVEQTFSTEWEDRCQDNQIEDPLLEPDYIGGNFVKYTREYSHDRFGNAYLNAAFEPLTGPEVEFDANRPAIWVRQNVADVQLDSLAQAVDHVNDAPLWGLPARTVKLSNVSWERLLFGTCNFFFVRTLEFDIMFDTFDRTLLDKGNKVLRGDWDKNSEGQIVRPADYIPDPSANPLNPMDYDEYKDTRGEAGIIIYRDYSGDASQRGLPATGDYPPSTIEASQYDETNFLIFGIPTVLD